MAKSAPHPENVMALLTRVKYAQEMTKWTFGWFLLFLAIRFGVFRRRRDFANRVVSIIHAVVAIYYSYACFENGFAGMFANIGGANTEPQALCMAVSLSYFVYDLVYCSLQGELEWVFHHFFTIGGLASGVLNGKSGAELCACLFLMEVSNPSLHLRTLLLEMGLKNTGLFSATTSRSRLCFWCAGSLSGRRWSGKPWPVPTTSSSSSWGASGSSPSR